MATPSRTDLAKWDGIRFDKNDWDANMNQIADWLSDGNAGLIVDTVTANSGFDSNGAKITNVGTPVATTDAVNKSYVDDFGVPQAYITGLIASQAADTDHDLTLSTGICKNADNDATIELTSAITKQIDAAWAAGDDQGGFPTGATLSADQTLYYFVISKADGTADAGFDDDASATNLLADATDYVNYREVFRFLTDGSSNIIAFKSREIEGGGVRVNYTTPFTDSSSAPTTTTTKDYTTSVPASTLADVTIAGLQAAANTITAVKEKTEGTVKYVQGATSTGIGTGDHGINIDIKVDSSRNFNIYNSAAPSWTYFRLYTNGYRLTRK